MVDIVHLYYSVLLNKSFHLRIRRIVFPKGSCLTIWFKAKENSIWSTCSGLFFVQPRTCSLLRIYWQSLVFWTVAISISCTKQLTWAKTALCGPNWGVELTSISSGKSSLKRHVLDQCYSSNLMDQIITLKMSGIV